jgi:hypothetical protein
VIVYRSGSSLSPVTKPLQYTKKKQPAIYEMK